VSDETSTPDEPETVPRPRRPGGRIAPDGTWLPAEDEPAGDEPAGDEPTEAVPAADAPATPADGAELPVLVVGSEPVVEEEEAVPYRRVRRWPVLLACIVVTVATAVLGALAYKAQHDASDRSAELTTARQEAEAARHAADAATERSETAEDRLEDVRAANTTLEAQVADLTAQLQAAQEAADAAAAHAAQTDAVVTAARPAVTQVNRCITAVDALSVAAHNLSINPLDQATVNAYNAATTTVVNTCGAAAAAAANLQQAINGVG
jgi:hypothetical protein